MTYEANKYRIRPRIKGRALQQLVRMDRLRSIKTIARLLKGRNDATIKDFHQRKISQEHKSKLRQIAVLWNDLDILEEAVTSRKAKKKTESVNISSQTHPALVTLTH